MEFGEIPVGEAEGAILAHSVKLAGQSFKKGRILSADDVAALKAADYRRITAARLGAEDVHEDEAAARLAAAVKGERLTASKATTGRVNLYASMPGLLVVDRDRFDRINGVDEAITIATLDQYTPVAPKQMVATIKIIPFAAPSGSLALTEAIAAQADRTGHMGPVVRLAPFVPRKVGLIQTRLPATKASVLDKTAEVTRNRLEALHQTLAWERRCEHAARTLAGELRSMVRGGAEMVLIAGASAITDRRDVLPAAIEAAGGEIEHFGMPVDPGNLLLLGTVDGVDVLGLPGCARSPKLNGFDWVLQRLAARLPVNRKDITAMGIGGLLTEIPTRPLPRSEATGGDAAAGAETGGGPNVAAIVLAAGQSRRMGARNKLLEDLDGRPLVVRTVDAALASGVQTVIVVTGHEPERVRTALGDRGVRFVHNPAYDQGLSTSLKAGVEAVPGDIDAALVCLADMPGIDAATIDALIAAYNPVEGRAIVVPTHRGKRGNPVLWDRRFFAEMGELAGDVGARHLIGAHDDVVAEVEMDSDAVLLDIDTPDALDRARDAAGTAPAT
ncbi:MAG: molybdopterin-binding/glycosyltransferase family 2 protein [Azospirillaceae bacterium]